MTLRPREVEAKISAVTAGGTDLPWMSVPLLSSEGYLSWKVHCAIWDQIPPGPSPSILNVIDKVLSDCSGGNP
jgi:hypothetical protein